MQTHVRLFPSFPSVRRLGLASRVDGKLTESDVEYALERGIRYFNWCGSPDPMSRVIARSGSLRSEIVVATQLEARTPDELAREVDECLSALELDALPIGTFYWVESEEQWQDMRAAGMPEAARRLKEQGLIRAVGVTSHHRKLAAQLARDGEVELLMIRYNAAHRGAEREIFPIAAPLDVPIVAFTCTRWGALLRSLPGDPSDTWLPRAPDCYRFVLGHPEVSIALMGPDSRAELEENLGILDEWHALSDVEMARIIARGDIVHARAGEFP